MPRAIIDSNCPLGIMLHQEQEIAENLAHLDKVLVRLGQPSNIFGAESIPVEEVSNDFLLEVVVTEEEHNDTAKQTILQSGCPQWHCAWALRISASSKVHRIKIHQADFREPGTTTCYAAIFQKRCMCIWHIEGASCTKRIRVQDGPQGDSSRTCDQHFAAVAVLQSRCLD